MIALIALHALVAVTAPLLAARVGPRAFWWCAAAPGATAVWAAWHAPAVLDGEVVEEGFSWLPALGVDVEFRLDPFALLMVALVAGIGVLVMAYSRWYFGDRAPEAARVAAWLTAFAGAMLGLVLADNLLVLYLFWELTSVTSFLLVGTHHENDGARDAARRALLVTVAGGLALLAGLILLAQEAGTWRLSELLADPPRGGAVAAALVLVLLGAFTKSAIVPFQFWLPGAMAAPTPVSTYLHAATMVKAGVYLVARLSPAFAEVAPWRALAVGLGVATMLVGGWRALREHDLKLLLAYGTVSQLGLMFALFGAGTPRATTAGTALLAAHAMFKAALFMVVGVVDHEAHTRDLRRLSGLWRALPWTFGAAALATASMAGLPPLIGFPAKELALEAFLHGATWETWTAAGLVTGSVFTVAYSARFLWGAFATKGGADRPEEPAVVAHQPAPGFLAPAALLAAMSLTFGAAPTTLDRVTSAAARALDPSAGQEHLVLWHGFTPALALSAVAVTGGAVLFLGRRVVESLQRRSPVPDAAVLFERGVGRTLQAAGWVTGIVQNGSLPVYLGVILVTLLVVPGSVALRAADLPDDLRLADSPLQAAVAVLVVVAAGGVARSRHRFVGVLFLGAAGYGVAGLFLIQGAPDLALTQLLIETVSVVAFVLVLRRLPENFGHRAWRLGQAPRMVIAAGVGVVVTVLALTAAGARTAPPVWPELVERAKPEGGGANVVNVILTDFRAFDTVGEVTVLTVAALGIGSLLVAGRAAKRGER